MRFLWPALAVLFLFSQAHAEDATLAGIFAETGVNGTIILANLDGSRAFIHNDVRAATRLPAASTFKIFNSLIALDEGVVSLEEVLVWDGRRHDFPDWNRDQTLASAYRISCVWCYQELARRIGAEKYRAHIRAAQYGQLAEPFDLTNFWLDGSFQVSAAEQIDFLRKIVRRSLPYKGSSYDTLRTIMVTESRDVYTLRAKTGWAARQLPQIGWYVGYVEKGDEVWLFATNIDIRSSSDLPLRQQVTMQSLKAKGIFK